MRRITSVSRAIKYFVEGTTTKLETYHGVIYVKYIPPPSFHRLTMTYNNGITQIYESFEWRDYVKILFTESHGMSKKTNGKLIRINLYINEDN